MEDERDAELTRRSFLTGSGAAVGAAAAPAQAREPPALDFLKQMNVALRVNGQQHHVAVNPRMTLLDWLREGAGLTGAKKGCNEGACGTCTVLIDGERMNGCLTLLVQCHGREVTTAEGIAAPDGALHPVQQAFIDHDAFQCGYCTPGQVVSAVACIREGHTRSEAEVREWMSGNLCRCSCYPQITAAVLAASGSSRRPRARRT